MPTVSRSPRASRVAMVIGALGLIVIPDDETPLHLATNAVQRCSCQHPFRRAALAEIDIDAGGLVCRVAPPRDITVRDQRYPAPEGAKIIENVFMARAVQNAGCDLFRINAFSLRKRLHIIRW